ncbi:hypothetical protein E0W68_10290 [Flavobacterium salilacus subsp. salilacus]|uniref:hypothetical protein n=1 Tax=Flavobacterium TaxID=237 RepID=UPI0010750884|nr:MULTISPECIES: hypothetical protein [Flavobacterium]KAF2518118.1 hypothetical protein E0W68_10290 [Flavobacterium salilacus subsp. salilacus]MBE1615572.1 hypothetical protein [Flavobacterium sp. SaA2.13]
MNEFSGYKRLKGKIITVSRILILQDRSTITEYIQGKLMSVDDEGIEIEQCLNMLDYLNNVETPTSIRKFDFRDVDFEGNFPA